MGSEEHTARTTHGQSIKVDGREFDIERVGRHNTDVWFELNISVEERQPETPGHEFSRILEPGGRSNLTDQYIEEKIQSWADAHPECTISGFGISEGRVARIGRPADSPEDSNDR